MSLQSLNVRNIKQDNVGLRTENNMEGPKQARPYYDEWGLFQVKTYTHFRHVWQRKEERPPLRLHNNSYVVIIFIEHFDFEKLVVIFSPVL